MIIEEISEEYKNVQSPDLSLNSMIQTENNRDQLVIISKQITKNKKVVNDKKKKIRLKRVNWLDIQLPFKINNVFQLLGHIQVEIFPDESEGVQLSVKKAQKSEQFFTLYQNNAKLHTQFAEVIYLLENSQSQQNYEASQQLRQFQKIYENQNDLIKSIKKQANFNEIQELQKERQKFKDNFILEYAKQNLTEDDFYIISSIGINIDKEVSDLNYVHFSKAYFALIGLDEQIICSSYILKLLFFLVFPPYTRRIMVKELLSTYISDKHAYTKKTAPFELYTLDKIKIDQIPYPSNLKNSYLDSLHISMNNILVTVFHVEDHHLKKILEQRTNFPINQIEDLEYTLFSEILLEKFYPKQLQKLQQKQILDDIQANQNDDEKRCAYKYINKQN